jgi:tetratricopeptide (TPR) repeat protein
MKASKAICAGAMILLLAAPRAFAQELGDPEAARTHFKLGIDSYRDNDLPTALIEFKRAYAASPNYRVLYNLAQVSEELRDYPDAERYLNQYLHDGQSEIDAVRRQHVEDELAKIKLRIASLVLTTNVEGAEWFVDDVGSGKAPLADAVRVSAGRHRIAAAASGMLRKTRVVDVAGGETIVVDVTLTPPPRAEPLVAAPAPLRPEASSHVSPALYTLIGTAVVGAGAGVLGYLAYHDSQAYKDALHRKTNQPELDSLASTARTKAIISDVLLGVAALGAGVTLYLAIDSSGSERAPSEHASVSVGPASVQLTQHF